MNYRTASATILVTYTLAIVVALVGFAATDGCGGKLAAPPGLSKQAVVAFHSTQVIRALDQVRDVADAAHHTNPPLIDAQTELKIVNWHQGAIKIAHDAKDGWVAALLSGLDALEVNLPGPQRAELAPYLSLVRVLISQLGTAGSGGPASGGER